MVSNQSPLKVMNQTFHLDLLACTSQGLLDFFSFYSSPGSDHLWCHIQVSHNIKHLKESIKEWTK